MKTFTGCSSIRIPPRGVLWCFLIQSVFLAAVQPAGSLAGEWKQIPIPRSETAVLYFFLMETDVRIQQLNSPPEGTTVEDLRHAILSEYSATEADLRAIADIAASVLSSIHKMDRARTERKPQAQSDYALAARDQKERDVMLQAAVKTLRGRLSAGAQTKLDAMLNDVRGRISSTRLVYIP
jgi:hypothetical protein